VAEISSASAISEGQTLSRLKIIVQELHPDVQLLHRNPRAFVEDPHPTDAAELDVE
jgi:hypothetical protein